MKTNYFCLITCVLVWLLLLGGWSNTLITSNPAGDDDPREADDQIRRTKAAYQERLDIDHYFEPSATNTYDDTDTGKHRQITFMELSSTPSGILENQAQLYGKAVSDIAELFWIDENDDSMQLTTGGYLNGAVIAANSVAELADGAVLAAATESGDGDRTVADKKYVDDNDAVGDDPTSLDSESETLVKAHAYLAQTSGFVTAWTGTGNTYPLKGYVGTTNDPEGAGIQIHHCDSVTSPDNPNIGFLVGNGKYFEITHQTQTVTIRWTPLISGGGAPIDQD